MLDDIDDTDYGCFDDLPINDHIDLQLMFNEEVDSKNDVLNDQEWLYF